MLTIQEIQELAVNAARGTVPANFSGEADVNTAFVDAINGLCGSVNQFMKNRYDIYEILVKTADEISPKKVISALSPFCEIQIVPQKTKAIFKKKMGKNRAKKFLTRVGLSGLYETFRLDNSTYEVAAEAIGGAVSIDFERMLDGAESIADLMDIMVEGQVDSVFLEVQKALTAAAAPSTTNDSDTKFPDANRYRSNAFDATEMQKLIRVARAYSTSATIFAYPEFIAEMGADAIVPIFNDTTNHYGMPGVYSPDDIEAIHRYGRISIFRGTPVVELPQSFVDETNTTTWGDPRTAFILPTGQEKVVKVVLEGETQINDFKNVDNSMEIHFYKKIGVAIESYHNWCVYINTAIDNTFESPYGI